MGIFVFGMQNVPLFEMLVVIMILLLIGLMMITIELRKLGQLITKEKVDISRFENDLATMKKPI